MNLFHYSIVLFGILCCSYAKENVPVLVWNNGQNINNIPSVSALEYINYETFRAKFLDQFPLQNVILFLQDSISVEDLSSHEKEMGHLSKLMDSDNSLFLPSVEDPAHIVHQLSSNNDYNVVKLEQGSFSPGGIELKSGNNLIIVNLPSTDTNPSRQRALQKTDEVIESVLSKIGKMADFTFIFTAKKSSLMTDGHKRVSRAISGKIGDVLNEDPPNFHRTDCILLYLRNKLVLIKGEHSLELPEQTSKEAAADCRAEQEEIFLSYTDVVIGEETFSKLDVSLLFGKAANYWALTGADLSSTVDSEIPEEHKLNKTSLLEFVPLDLSLSCSLDIILMNSNPDSDTTEFKLKISGLQVQAYTEKNAPAFGPSWDCVGFFTVPIWCGLLASLLATIILLVGLFMLAEVRTMDRFDDPKGKTIIIPNTD